MNVTLPNGKVIRDVPEGTSKDAIRMKAIQAGLATEEDFGQQPTPQEPSPEPLAQEAGGLSAGGVLEPLATVASGVVAEPIAGVAGIVQSLNPFADEGAAVEAVEGVREALTYDPSTEDGKANLISVAKKLKPLTDWLQSVEEGAGDKGYDIAGPVGGAIGETIPTAIGELLGVAAGRGALRAADKASDVANAEPTQAAKNVLEAGEQFDVPVLTTDVKPPSTYLGRFSQGLSEKLGPLGSGAARADQQAARQAAVQGFADSMDIDLDSPFAESMVKSLNAKTAKELSAAGKVRGEAVAALDKFGPLPMEKTKEAIAREIAKQERLGAKGDSTLIASLQDNLASIEEGDFSLVKDIRSEVISDLKAIGRSEDTRAAASVQSVKSAMDEDMLDFAKQHDRTAATKWVSSNRAFADAYGRTKDTELKRILKSGDVTPEKILPLLRGGKPSELKRLHRSMGKKGREAARSAIIQDALKESKFFEVDSNPNPDAFATALNKPNRQQAVNVFFEGAERKEIDGLTRLLSATRRAQQGAVAVKTGEQAIPMVAGLAGGAAITANAVAGLSGTALISAIAKTYESKRFRNLLLKLENTQPGSKRETILLDMAATSVASGFQAAKTGQQETTQEQ